LSIRDTSQPSSPAAGNYQNDQRENEPFGEIRAAVDVDVWWPDNATTRIELAAITAYPARRAPIGSIPGGSSAPRRTHCRQTLGQETSPRPRTDRLPG